MSHEKLAIALLTADTVREAAEQCGIAEGHIHRLKKDGDKWLASDPIAKIPAVIDDIRRMYHSGKFQQTVKRAGP